MGLAASHLPPSPLRGWVLGPPPCERLGRGPTLRERPLRRLAPWATWTQPSPAVTSLCSDRPVLCRQHLAGLTRLGCLRHNLPKPKAAGG